MADNTTPAPVIDAVPGVGMDAQPNNVGIHVKQDTEVADLGKPSALEVAAADWRMNTLIGQGYRELAHADISEPKDPSFNPWEYLKKNEAQYRDILPYALTDSSINTIQSEGGLRTYLDGQRLNLKDRETIARGDTWGHLLGVGASMFDLTSVASFGSVALGGVRAASTAGSVLKSAGVFALDAAAQEGVLQLTDSTRDADPKDLFMNIGIAASLGGVVGGIFRHAKPDSVLNPSHSDNPLHPDNVNKPQPVVEMRMGQTPEEGFTLDPYGRREPTFGTADSIGAARADAHASTSYEAGTELAQGGKVAQALDKASTFMGATPMQRFSNYSIPEARELFLGLADTGGMLTKANLEGVSHGPSAEDLALLNGQKFKFDMGQIDNVWNEANQALGQSAFETNVKDKLTAASQGAVDRNSVTRDAFNQAVFTIMRGSNTATPSTQISENVMKALRDAGLSEVQAKLVHPLVYKAEKTAHDSMEALWDRGVKVGAIEPDAKGEGRYGAPQVYDRAQIARNMQEFKNDLHEVFGSNPTEWWLREEGYIKDPNAAPLAEGVEGPQYESWAEMKEKATPTELNDILRAWRGEENDWTNSMLQARVDEATRRQAGAQADAADILQLHAGAEREWKRAKLDEMQSRGRSLERNAVLRKVASATYAAQKADAKISIALDKLGGDESAYTDILNTLQEQGMRVDDAGAAVQKARERLASASEAQTLTDALKGKVEDLRGQRAATRAEKVDVLGELKDVTENLAGIERARAQNPLRQQRDALNAKRGATQAEINEAKTAIREALEERREAQEALRRANADFDSVAKDYANGQKWHDAAAAEVKHIVDNEKEALLKPGLEYEMDGHIDAARHLKTKLDEATAARRDAFELRKQLGMAATEAEAESNKSAHALKKSLRDQRRLAHETHPVQKAVDEMANHFAGIDKAPSGLLLDELPDSGRVKERQITYSDEQYQRMVDKGFLKSNVVDLMEAYHKDLGGRIALHESLGGPFNKRMEAVLDAYDRKIGGLEGKAKVAAQNEKAMVQKDLEGLKNRVLGVYEPRGDDPVTYFLDRVRDASTLRFVGGFVMSAINDLATAAFAAPGSALKALTGTGTRQFSAILKDVAKGSQGAKELAMLMGSFEHGLVGNMSERHLGRGAGREYVGFGTGFTRKATTALEVGMQQGITAVSKLTGLSSWSDNIRRTAGVFQMAKIRQWVGQGFDALSKGQQAQLTALGIGRTEANGLAKLFAEHGETAENGLFYPNMGKWGTGRDALHLRTTLETALIKTQRRASLTGGYAHTPLMMDGAVGKLFLQFQTMAFAFANHFVRAGVQYGAVTGDHTRFAMAVGWALATGVAINALKSYLRGEDPIDQFESRPTEFAYNILQRSGLQGAYGAYMDAGVKLLDPQLKQQFGFTLGGQGSKFAANAWYENLLGAWSGTLNTGGGLVSSAVQGDTDKVAAKAKQLIPLNQYFGLSRLLFPE